MNTAQVTTVVVLVLIFLPLGVAKLAALPVMRRAAAHLGMSPNVYRVVGALELAAVVGLLAGLAATALAVAAAIGLALLMAGAAVAHLRHGDPPVRALPAAVLALVASAYAVVSAAG
ncbi:invasion protein [Streptomyces agglomeratus]|uniref:Invasion protein n=1 Tax=Streptomyces agglomeratus TaxID=285458 RepID=A0A1E5P1U0_9ACTN|nr:DoxX family protein [Streptomyces agglomeratus]OEJ23479.1 invasion protein [Streptomyces agglomeratus]OEJ43071.1 invasion protein [Streptomyces agglomeratus]OEJ55012.1 invasion protein [Streptomyces agglomeratus]OEJ62380.1 invasion protein [Streptomyces agglomeratus]